MTTNVPSIQFTEHGVQLPSEADVLAGRQADINTAFGGGVNPGLNTPQGQIAQSDAAIIGNKNDQIAEVANQVNPDYSDGRWQDAIGRIYFMDRIAASGTVVTGTCRGLVGTVIPVGAVTRDQNGYLYFSISSGTIGADGSVKVDFQGATPGPITCPVGAMNTIYRSIIGWESVTNESAGTPGVDVESRADFEFRRRNSVAVNALNTPQAIYAVVLAVPDVLDAYVIDNPEGVIVSKGATNYPVAAHSVFVSVAGGTPANVAKAIWSKKPAGCNYNGTTTATVIDDSGYEYPEPSYEVRWVTPSATPIFFNVEIVSNPRLPANIIDLVRVAIVDAFNGGDGGARARIGSSIFAGRYYSPVATASPGANIQTITLGFTTPGLDTSITLGIDQRPTLDANDITVTLV
ncbi:baseplate J/gp47 family protein [Serratia fonticola]